MANWKNRESVMRTLQRLPPALKQAMQETLDETAEEIVEAMKRACPAEIEGEHHPGELRESIHAYDGKVATKTGDRDELIKAITADARDEHGEFYGGHVEYGHVAKGGKHVPAHPFFWPTWRAMRMRIKQTMFAKGRAVAKAIAGDMAQ